MNQTLTAEQRWLIRRFYIYKMLSMMWFLGTVWLYFYRLTITDQQVGIIDSIAFAVGLLAEVPSGALADKYGRDTMVRLGQILIGVALLIQVIGGSFDAFLVGQIVLMIGAAFTSGADEALFFERLNFERTSKHWRKVITRAAQFGLVGSITAYVVGGYIHSINILYPWYLTAFAAFASSLLIWGVTDDRPRSKRKAFKAEVKEYILDIKTGFGQFAQPQLRVYIPLIIVLQGLFYAAGWGMLRMILLDRFHFGAFWGSVAVSSSAVISVLVLAYMHKHAEKINEKSVLLVIGLCAASALLLASANIGHFGYIVIVTLYVGENALAPFMSEILHSHAPERQRATILSVASFLKALPYVALAPIIGTLNTNGKLHYFLIVWPLLIVAVLLLYVSVRIRAARVSIVQD